MAKEIIFTERFKENYQRLPAKIQIRFDRQLEYFFDNPTHPSLKIHRYKMEKNIWEGYVTHKYRFTFSVDGESYTFRNIGLHAIIDKGKV